MSYRSLMTLVPGPEDLGALDDAIALATGWKAHLDALCLTEVVSYAPATVALAGTADLSPLLFEELGADLETLQAQAGARLATSDLGWGCEGVLGDPALLARLSVEAARFADLVLMDGRIAQNPLRETLFEAVLFRSGTPVMILPSGTRPGFARVMVCWDDSPQALAAARAALPLLMAADLVDIVSVAPRRRETNAGDPGASLALMLARHGVSCKVTTLAATLPGISDTLMRHARDSDADLVVMGGYGHARLREAILGGVTRDMIRRAALPVFVTR